MLESKKVRSWLKTVSAFSNTSGGTIFLGISDDVLIGLKNAKSSSEVISDLIKTRMDPIPKVNLQIVRKDNKDFITLAVSAGNDTPYYYLENGGRIAL